MGDLYNSYKRLDAALNMPMPKCKTPKPPLPPLPPPCRKVTAKGRLLNQHEFALVEEENIRRGYGTKHKVDATEEFLKSKQKPLMPEPPPILKGKVNKPPLEYSFWYIFGCGFATSSLFWAGMFLLKGGL